MFTLDDILDSLENLEMKRAIAVKMVQCDFKTEDICAVLNVSDSFVSKWKIIYENQGARALKVNYQGRTGYLTDRQRTQIFLHLRDKSSCSVEELRNYIERNFGVVYQSQQSYYDILKDAGLSWHQTQAANPQRDDAEVLHTRAEIKKNWTRVRPRSRPVKSLFSLKMKVTSCGETPSATSGVGGTSGRWFP